MGLAASQTRFLNLTSRQSDLEFQGQQINQKRGILANKTQDLFNEYLLVKVPAVRGNASGTPAEQAEWAAYLAEKSAYDTKTENINLATENLQSQDKLFEMQLKDIDTQHKTVQTEVDAVKKVIDKNIETTFKTFA